MTNFHYVGSELEVFAHANNWKSYVHSKLRLYLIGDVLEVGAGIGAATQLFNDGTQPRWVCLEPDPKLAARIGNGSSSLLKNCEVRVGALSNIGVEEKFD